ncbi:hypothetical protein [Microbispora hainanensis]|uniref:hypothetical protein n=1 Tax=Microbispora hainanensis TaxID=568844 RepID=UPI003AF36F36
MNRFMYRVRRELLPHARIKDLGTRCVYGRTPLTEEVAELLPSRLAGDPCPYGRAGWAWRSGSCACERIRHGRRPGCGRVWIRAGGATT